VLQTYALESIAQTKEKFMLVYVLLKQSKFIPLLLLRPEQVSLLQSGKQQTLEKFMSKAGLKGAERNSPAFNYYND
jgi:hypothetical protein